MTYSKLPLSLISELTPNERTVQTVGTILSTNPTLTLERDWFGAISSKPPQLYLCLSPTTLYFGAKGLGSPELLPTAAAGSFFEGLWEADLVELFLASGSEYQEINLAPNGAWWSAGFRGNRNRVCELPMPNAKTEHHIDTNGWWSIIAIPLNELLLPASSISQGNITAVLNQGGRKYYSAAALPGAQPNFHAVESFLPFRLNLGKL